MPAGDEEKKSVTQDELKAGVRLTAGHRVVLIVEGAVAATTTEAPGEPETTTAEPETITTTAHPATTTTAAPEESTEAPEETTTAEAAAEPGSTTAEPSSTTTSPGTTTTGPGTTTTAPSTTTTGPSTTTTGLGTTTTKAPGAQVVVELHADVLTLVPDGALVFSGDGIDEQQITFADAEQADGVLRFTFKWDDITKKVKLVATGSGKSVTLWEDQPAGDPAQEIVWSGAISDLYTPSEEEPGEPQSVGDDMPENLHLRDDEVDQ